MTTIQMVRSGLENAVEQASLDWSEDAWQVAHVYVVTNGDGHVKIGRARNPEARLRALNIGVSTRLELREAVPFPEGTAKTVESWAHRFLEFAQLRGEWFDVDWRDVVTLLELMEDRATTAIAQHLDLMHDRWIVKGEIADTREILRLATRQKDAETAREARAAVAIYKAELASIS